MALFGNKEGKEEKREEKALQMMAKFGLDSMTDAKDVEAVKKIINELAGTGLMEAGMKLSMGAKTEDQLQVQYQRVLMEQNWIIIRQFDRLNRNLENLK